MCHLNNELFKKVISFLISFLIFVHSISETVRNRIYVYIRTFLLKMTDTITSQNILTFLSGIPYIIEQSNQYT